MSALRLRKLRRHRGQQGCRRTSVVDDALDDPRRTLHQSRGLLDGAREYQQDLRREQLEMRSRRAELVDMDDDTMNTLALPEYKEW